MNRPRIIVVGLFMFLAAVLCAVLPLAPLVRSAAVMLLAYTAFTFSGFGAALLTGLLAPAAGLLTGDADWLVMLPIILSSNLLALLGLDLGWRYAAIVLSPLVQAAPQLGALVLSTKELFMVDLPWGDHAAAWVLLHLLTALFGVLLALFFDRRRRRTPEVAQRRSGGETGAAA